MSHVGPMDLLAAMPVEFLPLWRAGWPATEFEMSLRSPRIHTCAIALALAVLALPNGAPAETVADFYKGKTVNVLIGVGAGGEYDLQARLVARYLGKHIPGNPLVVAQNMTGAGGLKMANYLYDVAPKDGTYIGMIANSFPALQVVGLEGAQFDAGKFGWLGAMASTVETMAVWHTAGVHSIEDARKREIVAGASGKGAITYTLPAVMNEVLGTKFKIVTGYTGGNQINLAMERGEVQARNNTWSSWKATKPDWLRDKKLAIIAQAGPRAADLDAPSLEEMAKNAEDRQLIELIVSGTQLGRPLATTPGVPEQRLKALRDAFAATMQDPEFLEEARKLNFEVDPVLGDALQKVVSRVLTTPRSVAERARPILQE
jgi:tripartite-type tricarboxylate transporter receptor subunit TctC